ncbi:MAG: hypothetical protein DDT32_02366 [Syntrophomonadaceae bacterium]|nr:hypothetical protein [Bacillota bacterium]MBT9148591.1 hypothetical protein [Bacillota bacterium]
MFCPYKFNTSTLDRDGSCKLNACQCEEEHCALWEPTTGSCAFFTFAWIQARRYHYPKEAPNDSPAS